VLILGEAIVLSLYPPPSMVSGWFMLFQSHPLIELLDFGGWKCQCTSCLLSSF
jgi:hypothetical protein